MSLILKRLSTGDQEPPSGGSLLSFAMECNLTVVPAEFF